MATARTAEGSQRIESVLDQLRQKGGRVTTARRLLLEVLFDTAGHHTAEELAAEVQARVPDVHMSTIYRNLDELERLGVIIHAHLGHGAATYHLSSEMHGHLVCEGCGITVEVPDELFRPLARQARDRYGFTIDAHHFAMPGRCPHCTVPSRPHSPGARKRPAR